VIEGHKNVITLINRNPLKRALRLDKGRLAALQVGLGIDLILDRLAEPVAALRVPVRPELDVRSTAERIRPAIASRRPEREVKGKACRSQFGPGALPDDLLPSAAVTIGGSRWKR